MKKILTFIFAFFVLFGAEQPYITAYSSAAVSETEKENVSHVLIDKITGNEVSFDENETRAGFVVSLAKIFKLDAVKPEKYFFEDVKSFTENADYVYAAYNAGWISYAESFNADAPITGNEAVKIAVKALGYELLASHSGGYPTGYLAVAKKAGLLKGVAVQETLSKTSAYCLAYNMLTCNVFEQIEFGNVSQYSERESNMLAKLYNIYEIEGIISRTAYNSLNGEENSEYIGKTEVEGVSYNSDIQDFRALGVNHRVFVEDDGSALPEIVCMFEKINKSIEINLRDFEEKQGDTVYWYNSANGKRMSAVLKNPCVIYNGRRVLADADKYFRQGTGTIRLVDNSGNGYETVFINSQSFVNVYSFNTLENSLRDRNSSKYTVDLKETVFRIIGSSGEELDKFDIEPNDVCCVIVSADKGFVEIKKITNKITGKLTALKEDKAVIDGSEYYFTDYFENIYLNKAKIGTEAAFYVTESNEIISMTESNSDMMYAYAVAGKYETKMDETLKLKMFTQSGNMSVFELDEKASVDGNKNLSLAAVYRMFLESGEFVPQIIRYSCSPSGKINALDFRTAELPQSLEKGNDDKNSLVYYGSKSGNYKQYNATVSRSFHINSSVCFIIPDDLSDEDAFNVVGKSYFTNNTYYTFECYDLDETGGMGAIVYRKTKDSAIADSCLPVLVESVETSMNSGGDEGYNINYFTGSEFKTIFMKKEVETSKFSSEGEVRNSTHPVLSGGDIIRFETNQKGEINKLVCEFDGRKGVMTANKASVNASRWNSDSSMNPQFHDGQIYSYDDTTAVLSYARQLDGTYSFKPSEVHVLASCSNVACYDLANGQIRKLSTDMVKTYKNDGNDAYYAVICQDTFISKLIVCYEGMGEEEE